MSQQQIDSFLAVRGLFAALELKVRPIPLRFVQTWAMQQEVAALSDAIVISPFAADVPADRPTIPDGWIAPLEDFISELIRQSENSDYTDAQWLALMEEAIDAIPWLYTRMDHEALAAMMEASMGQATLGALVGRSAMLQRIRANAQAAPYAADTSGIAFAPLLDAVVRLDRKTPLAINLTSAEWADLPVQIRERGQFSARVESARFLGEIQAQMRARLGLEKELVSFKGKDGAAFVDRDSFIRSMRAIAEQEGLQTTNEAGRGTVRDIRSLKRLGLIFDMQDQSASNFARWRMDRDADILDAYPGYRLSESNAREPRAEAFWAARWREAGNECGFAGAARNDFLALKTSPIWALLSRFNTPWPPFDYGSTRVLLDADREECAQAGLLDLASPVPPADPAEADLDLNSGMEASLDGIAPDLVTQLVEQFGDAVQVVGNMLRWIR